MMPAAIPVADRMRSLQMFLKNTGRYLAAVDGVYGPKTKAAILAAMEDGPDTELSTFNYNEAAQRLNVKTAYILAFAEVEANGAGFDGDRPKILFEPHRFSKLTKHQFDKSNPAVSYPTWGERPYPRGIDARYAQLLEAVGLDAWAGFSACSYGKFQILGENYNKCGFETPWGFAFNQAYDEVSQLRAFETFVTKTGIIVPLRVGLWEIVAEQYNGTAYRKNLYDEKLAKAEMLKPLLAASIAFAPAHDASSIVFVHYPLVHRVDCLEGRGTAFRVGGSHWLSVAHVTALHACSIDGQPITVTEQDGAHDFARLDAGNMPPTG
jgi:hypothetical protein